MSASPSHAEPQKAQIAAEPKAHSRGGDFVTLTKPRLNFLVLLTTAAAYSLGAGPQSTLIDLVHTLVGTFLVAGGAAALNQVWERETDRLMRRTAQRPMADMRLPVAHGLVFGLLLTALGAAELAWFVNPLSSAVALVTTATYILFYTPLKLMGDNRGVVGVNMGHLWGEMSLLRAALERVIELYTEGKISPHVEAAVPFDRAADAHRLLETGKNTGKVVLVP